MKQYIKIDKSDNVIIVLQKLNSGTIITLDDSTQLQIINDIPLYHKVAIQDIKAGDTVLRYGAPIGYATKDIKKGEWVHLHNLDAVEIM